jgi:eukaryotic-like serine/threonine-protein kinase
MAPLTTATGYRFGPFLLDLAAGELRRNGRRVRLQEKPLRLLVALAERPGEVISRNELHERLWSQDTFVAFEDGLNTAVRKLREVLGDDPQNPRFIETVRGRGYRLVMEVSAVGPQNGEAAAGFAQNGHVAAANPPLPPSESAAGAFALPRRRFRRWTMLLAASLAVALCAVSGWYWLTRGRSMLASAGRGPVLIADFDNQTGNPRFDNALYTALTVSLEQSHSF